MPDSANGTYADNGPSARQLAPEALPHPDSDEDELARHRDGRDSGETVEPAAASGRPEHSHRSRDDATSRRSDLPGQRGAGGETVAGASSDPIKAALQSVAVVSLPGGHGSGFVAAPRTLVTNSHVIAKSRIQDVRIRFPDNRSLREQTFQVELVAEDPVHDLAILQVKCDVSPLELDTSFAHSNGHRVVAIGSPGTGGADGEMLANLPTDGRLGPEHRPSTGSVFWAMAMPINPGNSGGPILDADSGRVVGVVVAKFTRTDSQSLAVPLNQVVATLKQAENASPKEIHQAQVQHRARFCLAQMARLLHLAHLSFEKSCEAAIAADNQTAEGKLRAFNQFKSDVSKLLSDEFVTFETKVTAEVELLRQDAACDHSTKLAIKNLHSTVSDQVQNLRKSVSLREVDHFLRDFNESLVRGQSLANAVAASIAFDVEDVKQ